MRYGKKLALHRTANAERPPYINHKFLKTFIERMVYQLKRGKDIREQDLQFFEHVSADIARIASQHLHVKLVALSQRFCLLQILGVRCGFLLTEEQRFKLSVLLDVGENDTGSMVSFLCALAEDHDCGEFLVSGFSAEQLYTLQCIPNLFAQFLSELDYLTDYIEINVAGFRKLLKQRAKQFGALKYDVEAAHLRGGGAAAVSYHSLVLPKHAALIEAAGKYRDAFCDLLMRKQRERLRVLVVAAREGGGCRGEQGGGGQDDGSRRSVVVREAEGEPQEPRESGRRAGGTSSSSTASSPASCMVDEQVLLGDDVFQTLCRLQALQLPPPASLGEECSAVMATAAQLSTSNYGGVRGAGGAGVW